MLRLHKFEFLDVYREETFTGMKAIVKQVQLSFKQIVFQTKF